MSFREAVAQRYQVVASDDVLIAWEFDPNTFHNALRPTLAAFKQAGIPYDLAHDRKPGSPDKMNEQGYNLGPLSGNDWSHVSVGMLKHYTDADLDPISRLAKANVPVWKVKGYGILPTTRGVLYLVLDLDFPAAAAAFEQGLRQYGGERFSTAADKGWAHRPHVTLVGFRPAAREAVEELVKKLPLPVRNVPTEAVQIWKDFHVLEHVPLR